MHRARPGSRSSLGAPTQISCAEVEAQGCSCGVKAPEFSPRLSQGALLNIHEGDWLYPYSEGPALLDWLQNAKLMNAMKFSAD